MNNMPDSSSMTLESIALRKKELRKKLHVQKEIMTDTARELFAPLAPAADKGNAIMRVNLLQNVRNEITNTLRYERNRLV